MRKETHEEFIYRITWEVIFEALNIMEQRANAC